MAKTFEPPKPRMPGHVADDFVSKGRPHSIHDEAPTPREPAPAARESYVVTTFRISQAQAHALRVAALELQRTKGGKADASEVLRGILEEWMRR